MKDMTVPPLENKETIQDTLSYKFLEFKNEAGETLKIGKESETLDDYYSRIMKKYDLKKDQNIFD